MYNNNMVSIQHIINDCLNNKDIYIPLIQRNYKWDAKIAAKLSTDLWRAFSNKQKTYTVGMITLFNESDCKMQLIDGQQRIVTLYMLLKYVKPDEEYFSFRFERDEGITETEYTRQDYLKKINSPLVSEKNMYTDLIRFRDNFNKMKSELVDCLYHSDKADSFSEYIRENVYFLLHASDVEPFDEFINLNKNKTRFVISDRIKANLIIGSTNKTKRDKVLALFKDLSKLLFSKQDIWDLVRQGYYKKTMPENSMRRKDKIYPDENRLKLLCCERYGSDIYDVSGTLGYNYDNELAVLNQHRNILDVLSSDIESNNWNSYNAFNCLYKLDEIAALKEGAGEASRFFEMLKSNEYEHLECYLLDKYTKMKRFFSQACFIESQLSDSKLNLGFIDNLYSICREFDDEERHDGKEEYWLYNGKEECKTFIYIYSDYIKDKYDN